MVDRYPSRFDTEPHLMDRKDPVVWGSASHGPLTGGHLEKYERDGFLTFDNFFSEKELRAYQDELSRLSNDRNVKAREETITEPDSGEVRSIFDIHHLSAIIGRQCRDERIVAIARQLLGSDVYFHQTRINYKPGFRGTGFYWHSDFETWHTEDGMPNMRAVSCSISLSPNTEYNGPLMVIPGSHKKYLSTVGETPEDHYKHSLQKQEIGVPDDASLARMFEEGGIASPTGSTGLVTFFECNMMHGSNSNITPLPRSNVFIVFNSVENTVVEPFCGLKPRPQFIANRKDFKPIVAVSGG
ncbi:MAG: ectoine hydroxylase [Proteobacteria bacterium]|nr:ectoine hydroxylase [Pseudomonadota bacterium]